MKEYPAWSTDTNDIENTNEAQYRENRQDIPNAWPMDTPVKMPDNSQVLDNKEACMQDRLNITQSLNHRLGPRKSSLTGAPPVTVATVHSDQLITNITNHLSNSIATGQQDDSDYQDNREEEIYQVDGTMDVQSPTDNSDDNEDNEPDNNALKRQRKTYAPADTVRKEMTKQRQADVLKKQQEKERAKAQAEARKINLIMQIGLDHINLKVKHPTLIKLKVLKRVEEWLEHIMIIDYQMILNLMGTPKIKTF